MFFRESSRRVDCQVRCGDVIRALYLPFSLSLPLFLSRAPSLSPRVRTAPRPDAFASSSSSSSSCLLRVPPFPASCSAGVDRVRVAHATRERERDMRFQTLNFDKHIVRDANLATRRHHAIEPLRRCKSAFPRGSVGHRIRTHFRSPHARTASTHCGSARGSIGRPRFDVTSRRRARPTCAMSANRDRASHVQRCARFIGVPSCRLFCIVNRVSPAPAFLFLLCHSRT